MGKVNVNNKLPWLKLFLLFFIIIFIGRIMMDYVYGDPIDLGKRFLDALFTTVTFTFLNALFGQTEKKKGK